MSLSAYLTRDEWNAAFFVAAHASAEGRIPLVRDLSDQLRWGIVLLHKAGLAFGGVEAHGDSPDDVEKVTCLDNPSNVGVLADVISGRFDGRRRLYEFLDWAGRHAEVDVASTVASICEPLGDVRDADGQGP